MRSDKIQQIFKDERLVDEILALNREIISSFKKGIEPISSLRDLALAWQRWQRYTDQELIELVSNHSHILLNQTKTLNTLINYWFATPVQPLRCLISQRLQKLIADGTPMSKDQIMKLSIIFSQTI